MVILDFFIFSDDIEWCRKKFKNTVRFKIIGHEYAGKKFKKLSLFNVKI